MPVSFQNFQSGGDVARGKDVLEASLLQQIYGIKCNNDIVFNQKNRFIAIIRLQHRRIT